MDKVFNALLVGLLLSLSTGGPLLASKLPDCPSSGYHHNCVGIYTDIQGATYIGEFMENKFHGQGKLSFANGDIFVGEFRDGSEVYGTLTHKIGSKYVGQFRDGNYNGYGTFTYKYGDIYEGEFRDGFFHGQGTYSFINGDIYIGEFRKYLKHGKGTLIYADGKVKEGIWKDGEFQYAKKLKPKKPEVFTEEPSQDNTKIVSASSGSGFAVSKDGYVITNHHVINGCEKVFIHANGLQIDADVITFDKLNDLALLKADFNPHAVLSLSSKRPELLQDIYVAGYPFGMNISTSVKVTKGIVSSLTGIGNNFSQIQIDAALQGGNSGGPILDDNGNVVGVAVSKLDVKFALKNFGSIPENTNFGIKTSVVASILDSSRVNNPPANEKPINKSELAKIISNGTFYISCWMTMADIDKMRTKKVMFSDFDKM